MSKIGKITSMLLNAQLNMVAMLSFQPFQKMALKNVAALKCSVIIRIHCTLNSAHPSHFWGMKTKYIIVVGVRGLVSLAICALVALAFMKYAGGSAMFCIDPPAATPGWKLKECEK